MARLNRQGGYFVEYLNPDGISHFQACNAHREEAMNAARTTSYVSRVWDADGCAEEDMELPEYGGATYKLTVILFLISPRLIFENVNDVIFEV